MMETLTPLTWMWILSVAGALAFFGAGALTAARHATRVRAMAPPLARALSEVAALDDDRKRLADEVTRLTHELSDVRRARPPSEESSRVIEADAIKRRLAEADELREENARLRGHVARAQELTKRVSILEGELAKARKAPRPTPAPPQPRAAAARPTARLATSPALGALDAIIAELRADPRVRSAVVSDELGLLVAGGGEGAETMAALGGYLAGVGVRAQGLLHMDSPAKIVVEDDHGSVLTATRLDGAPLVAVTLSRAS